MNFQSIDYQSFEFTEPHIMNEDQKNQYHLCPLIKSGNNQIYDTFQTPPLISRGKMIKIDNRYSIDFELSPYQKKFYTFLCNLDEHIIHQVFKNVKKWFRKIIPYDILEEYSKPILKLGKNQKPIWKIKISEEFYHENSEILSKIHKGSLLILNMKINGIRFLKQQFTLDMSCTEIIPHESMELNNDFLYEFFENDENIDENILNDYLMYDDENIQNPDLIQSLNQLEKLISNHENIQSPPNISIPTNIIDEIPTNIIDEIPTNTVDEIPTNTVDDIPTNTVDEIPTNTVDDISSNINNISNMIGENTSVVKDISIYLHKNRENVEETVPEINKKKKNIKNKFNQNQNQKDKKIIQVKREMTIPRLESYDNTNNDEDNINNNDNIYNDIDHRVENKNNKNKLIFKIVKEGIVNNTIYISDNDSNDVKSIKSSRSMRSSRSIRSSRSTKNTKKTNKSRSRERSTSIERSRSRERSTSRERSRSREKSKSQERYPSNEQIKVSNKIKKVIKKK